MPSQAINFARDPDRRAHHPVRRPARQHLAVRDRWATPGDGGGHAERGAAGAHRRSMGGQVVKTLGDGLMAMFILPRRRSPAEEMHDSMGASAARAVRCRSRSGAGGAGRRRGRADVGRRVRRCGQRRGPAARPCRRQRDPAHRRGARRPAADAARALPQPRAHAAARPCRAGARSPARRRSATRATRRPLAFGDMPPAAEPEGIRSSDDAEPRLAAPTCRWCSDAARRSPTASTTRACRACMHASTGNGGTFRLTDLSYNGNGVLRPRPRGDQPAPRHLHGGSGRSAWARRPPTAPCASR